MSTTIRAYVTARDASEYIGVTERALAEWRRRGGGPPYVRLGGRLTGRIRYDVRLLDEWMRSQIASHTSAESARRRAQAAP